MVNDKPKRRGRVENLKPYKKGESGNPSGRALVPDDIKKARSFTAESVERSIHRLLKMTKPELIDMLSDTRTSTLDLLLGSILAKGMSGDPMRGNFILDRAGAQLPEATPLVNVNVLIQNMPNSELLPLAERALQVIRSAGQPISPHVKRPDEK